MRPLRRRIGGYHRVSPERVRARSGSRRRDHRREPARPDTCECRSESVRSPRGAGREQYLGPPTKAWVESRLETLEEGEMPPVTNGIAVRVQGCRQLKANDRRDSRGQVDREHTRVATLGPLEPIDADAHASRHLAQAHTAIDPGVDEFICEALAKERAAPRSHGRHAFAARHRRIMADGDCLALIGDCHVSGIFVEERRLRGPCAPPSVSFQLVQPTLVVPPRRATSEVV